MVEVPDSFHSVFTASLQEHGEEYVVEVPKDELEHDAVHLDETYRIAVLPSPTIEGKEVQNSQSSTGPSKPNRNDGPPVEKAERLDVTIEAVGDQGDGIAKVDRGYVVFVPGAQPGEQLTVEIQDVKENVAFANVIEPDPREI